MFWAVRLLTLVTFTAHAVLGCCLMHGNCMQKQPAGLSVHDGDHLCSLHHDDEGESHAEQVAEFAAVDAFNCDSCPIDGHDHSHHCDDAKCVFGVVGTSTTLPDVQLWSDAVWASLSLDSCLLASRRIDFISDSQAKPPRAPHNRAVLQVWNT